MKTTKWMALLAVGTALLSETLGVNAQYVQNAIATPVAPGCGPGESWTKDGVRYQCETPRPSCAYGFASGPVWTGSAWSFSCNAPPTTQPGDLNPTTPQDPNANCHTAATAAGFTITSGFQQTSCQGYVCLLYNSTGPYAYDGTQCSQTSHLYYLFCTLNPNNTVFSITTQIYPETGCGGQGG